MVQEVLTSCDRGSRPHATSNKCNKEVRDSVNYSDHEIYATSTSFKGFCSPCKLSATFKEHRFHCARGMVLKGLITYLFYYG